MDPIYTLFTDAHPLFYDKPRSLELDPEGRLSPNDALSWGDWEWSTDDTWSFWRRRHSTLPEQGWKVHVSVTPTTAGNVLDVVSAYCHGRDLAFKFLRDFDRLYRSNSKDADRASSGKFLTVYPPTEHALKDCLHALDAEVGGLPGPYILSDLRWNEGPLHVRYGAFARQHVMTGGVEVAAIKNLDTDELVPDLRTTTFLIPEWVRCPSFLQEQIDALDLTPPSSFPVVTRALHHSNAGGVYEAEIDGVPAVLKEARPHTGWTPDGRDAVARLRHEEDTLRALGPLPTPSVLGVFEAHGHRFLALEKVPGTPLGELLVARHPLIRYASSAESQRAYRDWALSVASSLRHAVQQVHAAGRTHGDLHPGNVLVLNDESVVLIDLEMSRRVDDDDDAAIGVPGFFPVDGRRSVERDLYALACIELFLFIPLTTLLPLDDSKAVELVRAATAEFELDAAWTDEKIQVLTRRTAEVEALAGGLDVNPIDASSQSISTVIDEIVRGLEADATIDRADRLWAGDPAQFGEPSYSVAHGALGVLASLSLVGRHPSIEELGWVERAHFDAPVRNERAGLFDGTAGAVWAFRQIGAHSQAERALARLRMIDLRNLGTDLYSGLPGVGLTLLAESGADPLCLETAIEVADRLRDHWESTAAAPRVATGRGGLLHGATGTALFALRLYERTGEAAHLQLTRTAIDHDLASLVASVDGSLQVNEGWRVVPYLGHGSAGIGLVLSQMIPRLEDPGPYLDALEGVSRAAFAPFAVQSGLLQGRAGLIQFLLSLEASGLSTADSTAALERHVSQVALHALRRADGIRFAGNALLRASCDLATGASGVLSALVAYRAERRGDELGWVGLPHVSHNAGASRASYGAPIGRGGETHGIPSVASSA